MGARAGHPLSGDELDAVLALGAAWAVDRGMGTLADLERTEEQGVLTGADPACVSDRARARGADQLGTLGSGNHFLEIQETERILDAQAAEALGLQAGQVVVMIHCGSRGLGHQVCTDHLGAMDRATSRGGIALPDRQLACAPLDSDQARRYLAAMAAASNFAWTNRQLIAHAVRGAFERVVPGSAAGIEQVYDLSHNIAKFEEHEVDGSRRRLCVHRKGATRAFPAGHPDVPERYRAVGQPVLIPGDMGRSSFIAVGAAGSMAEAFGSSCHGAGRALSRKAAIRQLRGSDIAAQLRARGIVVRAERPSLLAEEASEAYKDVEAVVEVSTRAGLIKPVARLRPLAVIKG